MLFRPASFAKGGGRFFFLCARRRVTALTKILLFGAITHHAGMNDLGLLPGIIRGRGFIRHVKYSARFTRWLALKLDHSPGQNCIELASFTELQIFIRMPARR